MAKKKIENHVLTYLKKFNVSVDCSSYSLLEGKKEGELVMFNKTTNSSLEVDGSTGEMFWEIRNGIEELLYEGPRGELKLCEYRLDKLNSVLRSGNYPTVKFKSQSKHLLVTLGNMEYKYYKENSCLKAS